MEKERMQQLILEMVDANKQLEQIALDESRTCLMRCHLKFQSFLKIMEDEFLKEHLDESRNESV